MQVPLRPAWLALSEHARSIRHRHLRELFSADPGRGLTPITADFLAARLRGRPE